MVQFNAMWRRVIRALEMVGLGMGDVVDVCVCCRLYVDVLHYFF